MTWPIRTALASDAPDSSKLPPSISIGPERRLAPDSETDNVSAANTSESVIVVAPEPSSAPSEGTVTSASSVAFVTDVPDSRPIWRVVPETPTSSESTRLSSTWTDTASASPADTVTWNVPDTSSLVNDGVWILRVTTLPEPLMEWPLTE